MLLRALQRTVDSGCTDTPKVDIRVVEVFGVAGEDGTLPTVVDGTPSVVDTGRSPSDEGLPPSGVDIGVGRNKPS